jgi:hypothetical protein
MAAAKIMRFALRGEDPGEAFVRWCFALLEVLGNDAKRKGTSRFLCVVAGVTFPLTCLTTAPLLS